MRSIQQTLRTVALTLVGTLALSGLAHADPWAVCKTDAEKLCKGKEASQLPACLSANEAQLSEDCASLVWKFQVAQICQPDRDRLCRDPSVPLGQCFKENEKNLSDKCRDALVSGSQRAKAEKKVEAPAQADETPAKQPASKKGKADSKKTK